MNVFWFDELSSSKNNGIGTYRNILLPRLSKKPDIDLTLISLNCDVLDLKFAEKDGYKEFIVPNIAGGEWRNNGALILPVLRQYIEDSTDNIFMLNHSPCNDFAKMLKELFPLSKVTFTIHDQAWCSTLLGSYDLLQQILVEGIKPDALSTDAVEYVKQRAQQDIELFEMVDAVICLSETTRKVLAELYGIAKSKIHFIPNGYECSGTSRIEKSAVRRQLRLRDDEDVMLFVGRPSANKGILPILLAMTKLLSSRPNLKCVFTGSPAGLSKFWHVAGEIAPNIICIGQVPHQELCKWYSAADVGIIASYSEQCSYAALEMMEYGLPIVSSDGNGLCNMFTDGENACIAKIGNVFEPEPYAENLAKAIERTLSSPEETKKRMASTNHRLLSSKYSTNSMIDSYAQLLQTI